MKTTQRHMSLLLLVVPLCLSVLIGCIPRPHVSETIAPPQDEQQRIRLDHGLVMLNQTFVLPAPDPTLLSLRIWVQTLPSYKPYLSVFAAVAPATFGPVSPLLPPADGRFHLLELPWWKLPPNARSMALAIKGHGVLIMTTTGPSVAGSELKIDGVQNFDITLAVQLRTRTGGIEHYLPLSYMSDGRPGMLGSPYFFLYLLLAFITGVQILILLRPALMIRLRQSTTQGTLITRSIDSP
jgi:hypothetical protein